MKIVLMIFLLVSDLICQTQAQKTELIIIGNVHAPMPNYNSDSLLAILERLDPDIILHEIDSASFTADNKFKHASTENEQNATKKYIEKHPSVKIGPFEFEGRNEYRRHMGIKQSDEPTWKLLDSMYRSGMLKEDEANIVREYYRLTDSLTAIAHKTSYYFNNSYSDSISKLRQYYQHYKILEVVNHRDEFNQRFVETTTGKKITLREGYSRQCAFWDLRNQTMAKNILRVVDENPKKRIIVLTGFFHRYYLLTEIKKLKDGRMFSQREFYN